MRGKGYGVFSICGVGPEFRVEKARDRVFPWPWRKVRTFRSARTIGLPDGVTTALATFSTWDRAALRLIRSFMTPRATCNPLPLWAYRIFPTLTTMTETAIACRSVGKIRYA